MNKKSKAIIGIVIAAIMIASVMAAMVTPVAAFVKDPRTVVVAGSSYTNNPTVIRGELITLADGGVTLREVTATTDAGIPKTYGYTITADAQTNSFITDDAPSAIYQSNTGTFVTIADLTFRARLQVGGSEVSSCIVSQRVDVVVETNIFGPAATIPNQPIIGDASVVTDMRLRIFDKGDGVYTTAGIAAPEANAPIGAMWSIYTPGTAGIPAGTSGLPAGDYEIHVETYTEGPAAASIDATTEPTKPLVVLTQEISIETEKTEQTTGNDILVTVRAGANIGVTITLTGANGVFNLNKGDYPARSLAGSTATQFIATMPPDGKLEAIVTSATTGAVTIDATITADPTVLDTSDVSFKKPRTTVELSTNRITIGDKVLIAGHTNSGVDEVAIFISDILRKRAPIRADKTYEWEWDTGRVARPKPGSVTIKVFDVQDSDVLRALGNGLDARCGGKDAPTPASVFYDPELASQIPPQLSPRPADTSTGLLAVAGDLTAGMESARIAKEDDIIVMGTAAGESQIRMILIDKDGGVPAGYDTFESVLNDDTFEYRTPTTSSWSSGTYKMLVISDGRDGETLLTGGCNIAGTSNCPLQPTQQGIWDANLLVGAEQSGRLFSPGVAMGGSSVRDMTQSQLIAKIDELVHYAGSDDKMVMLSLKVEDPSVEISNVGGKQISIDQMGVNVTVTDTLTIGGLSNRVDGTELLVTASNAEDIKYDLSPGTAVVADGVFSVVLDATGAVAGQYAVKVDDLSKATDELDVVLSLEAVEKIKEAAAEKVEEVIEKITATPEPTPTPTPTPEPTPEPPGFEAIFAIAGLLAVAYLVHRRKN